MKSIRQKIMLTILLCSISLALVITWVSGVYSSGLIRQEAEEKLANLTISHSMLLNNMFVEKETVTSGIESMIKTTIDLDRLYNEPGYLNKYEEQIEPYIRDMAEKYGEAWIFFNPFIDNEGHDVWYFDNDGDGSPERIPEQSFEFYKNRDGKEWYFTPMETREPYWTNPYLELEMLEGKDMTWISYGSPVYVGDTFIGVAGMDFTIQQLRDDIENLSIYDTGYAVLLNAEYEILIHPDQPANTRVEEISDIDVSVIMDAFDENDSGILAYTWLEGSKKLMAYTRLENNWILLVTATRNAVYDSFFNQLSVVGGLILIGIVFAIGFGKYLSASLSKPLEGMTELVKNMGGGNYDEEMPREYLEYKDEIGILANSVDNMRKHNKMYLGQIKEYNNGLETLVEKRTNQLEQSHKEIVETKKSQAITNLVMEVAHRLNTPLGISITSLTHSIHKVQELIVKSGDDQVLEVSREDLETIDKSLDLVMLSIVTSAETVKTLQKYSKVTASKEEKNIEISEYLEGVTSFIIMKQPNNVRLKINIQYREKIVINTYINLFNELVNYMTEYALEYSTKNESECIIDVHLYKKKDKILIKYTDNGNLSYSEYYDKVFEPFAFSSFDVGSSGLQLHLAYYIVTQGLKGEMRCVPTSGDTLSYEIVLPEDVVAKKP